MGRTRGNKTGSVYRRKDRDCWTAQIVVGWKPPNKDGGKMIPIKKTLNGFKTKKEALHALDKLMHGERTESEELSLQEVFTRWKEYYSIRVKTGTMKGYEHAYSYLGNLKYRKITTITAPELQKCLDDCSLGKRTHQMIKVTAGLIWAYALDSNFVDKDITDNLYIGKHKTKKRKSLTTDDLKKIKDAIGKLRYADYIYCQCYLGFRPGEFLEIKKDQVKSAVVENETIYYITEGIKTDAGIDRNVVIPRQILDIVLDRLWIPGTEYLFPFYYFRVKDKHLIELRRMKTNYYAEAVFKQISKTLGIEGKVPYSARHTYADKLKHAEGDERDKAALIGHTDYDFTRRQYQSSPLEDLKAVVDSIE